MADADALDAITLMVDETAQLDLILDATADLRTGGRRIRIALEFVNVGGTGSIESTAAEEAVTEIAAESGLIGPGLFDHYRDFTSGPALHLGVSVVRRPAPGVATLLGGGWIASGAPAADRLPTIAHPPGLAFAPQEAAGEVQTHVLGPAADDLRVGDTVWLRHAEAGSPAEHFGAYVLVQGEESTGSLPTYRGEGAAFL